MNDANEPLTGTVPVGTGGPDQQEASVARLLHALRDSFGARAVTTHEAFEVEAVRQAVGASDPPQLGLRLRNLRGRVVDGLRLDRTTDADRPLWFVTAEVDEPQPLTVAALVAKPVEHQGARVITLAQVDELHERASGTAHRTFKAHRDRLTEGEDYFTGEVETKGGRQTSPPSDRVGLPAPDEAPKRRPRLARPKEPRPWVLPAQGPGRGAPARGPRRGARGGAPRRAGRPRRDDREAPRRFRRHEPPAHPLRHPPRHAGIPC